MNINWDIFNNIIEKKIIIEKCCDNPDYKIEYNKTCINCGMVDAEYQKFSINHYKNNLTVRYYQPYKRIIYLKQKLNLLSCRTYYPDIPKIRYFIEKNKGKKFKSLKKLLTIMKNAKLNKYYKFIYSIYFSITNQKLIDISNFEMNDIIKSFLKLEKKFIKLNIRKNIFSYNVIIYLLLKQINNPGHKYILLPLNSYKIKNQINKLSSVI